MISLLCIIFLALTIFFFTRVRIDKDEKDDVFCFFTLIFAALFVAFLIWALILIGKVSNGYIIDEKIAMYEEENTSIEESIDVAVKACMDFEASTYGELKDKDSINLVSQFPQLKSDTLVQKQIEIYVSNNNEIKALKEEKIDLSKSKWELYFGR